MKVSDYAAWKIDHNGEIQDLIQCNYHDFRFCFIKVVQL